jgi:cobalamin biosynthetic protein CobC
MVPDCLTAAAPAHGGNLGAARRQFPGAPEPFIDLSTGINPHPYPFAPLPPEAFTRLPEPDELAELAAIASRTFGAPSAAHVVPAPGSQILLTHLAAAIAPGRAAVLGPTYAEHARAAALAGHAVEEVGELALLPGADLVVVTNPNNPDGRMLTRQVLVALAEAVSAGNGLLVVDEAFMDAAAANASVAGDVAENNLVVLRSFGKFFGLAGLRLGFAVAGERLAGRLRAALGPWPIAGPALAIGRRALADGPWMSVMRARLAGEALRLARLLGESGLAVMGGTPLFQLVQTPAAASVHQRLGRAGILVRRFPEQPDWLRFGLPAGAPQWRRLTCALKARA